MANPTDIGVIDREVEALTVRITRLASNADERPQLAKQIADLQKQRVRVSEPRGFREVAAMVGL